jgi:S-adenosylmethionine decarboxylase
MKKLGAHYLIELVDCNPETLSHTETVEAGFVRAAEASKATILNVYFHQFSPHGVSGVILIAESHFTIHTWPEENYAAIDFFTCGEMEPEKAIDVFKEVFMAGDVRVKIVDRGY